MAIVQFVRGGESVARLGRGGSPESGSRPDATTASVLLRANVASGNGQCF